MRTSTAAFIIRLLSGATARGDIPAVTEAPRLFYANHTSNLDFPVLWSLLPARDRINLRPVAAHDYWIKGRIRPWLARDVFNAILIERLRPSARNHPLRPIESALREGSSVLIFPEGTRSLDGALGSFRSGVYHLAKDIPGLECAPVFLENMNRILPKGEFLPAPLLCFARFGKPLVLSSDEPRADFLDRLRNALVDLSDAEDRRG